MTVRVGIAHPSPSAIEVLRRAVSESGEFEVVWTARTAEECRRKDDERPVAMLLVSIAFPGERASTLVRSRVAAHGAAVLLVRDASDEGAAEVYAAMDAGALDVVELPGVAADGRLEGVHALRRKLELIGRLGRRPGSEPSMPSVGRADPPPARTSAAMPTPVSAPEPVRPTPNASTDEPLPLVVIGASTGGPAAIARILSGLARPVEAAIVIVQHVDGPFAETVGSWLSHGASFDVALAEVGDRPRLGSALLAATSNHLVMNVDGSLAYAEEPRENPYRPSVDVFFESVARNHRGPVVGVLLTGMGRDGAKGLLAIRRKGHETIAQDEATSVVFGMPRAAIELEAATETRPLDRIAGAIERALTARRRTSASGS